MNQLWRLEVLFMFFFWKKKDLVSHGLTLHRVLESSIFTGYGGDFDVSVARMRGSKNQNWQPKIPSKLKIEQFVAVRSVPTGIFLLNKMSLEYFPRRLFVYFFGPSGGYGSPGFTMLEPPHLPGAKDPCLGHSSPGSWWGFLITRNFCPPKSDLKNQKRPATKIREFWGLSECPLQVSTSSNPWGMNKQQRFRHFLGIRKNHQTIARQVCHPINWKKQKLQMFWSWGQISQNGVFFWLILWHSCWAKTSMMHRYAERHRTF